LFAGHVSKRTFNMPAWEEFAAATFMKGMKNWAYRFICIRIIIRTTLHRRFSDSVNRGMRRSWQWFIKSIPDAGTGCMAVPLRNCFPDMQCHYY
jgi:hypothetical protein